MTAVDYILEGLQKALEVERECGVRSFEIDRELVEQAKRFSKEVANPAVHLRPHPSQPQPSTSPSQPFSLIFLHDRPLSPKGVEMMAKILNAMHLSVEVAPVVVAPPVPKAKIVVILGGRALARYYPDLAGEPGRWVKAPTGEEVLITYSPEYILRFGTVTPVVKELKFKMWKSLQEVLAKI